MRQLHSLLGGRCFKFGNWLSPCCSGEPHSIRRRELLAKYGDKIKKLYGYDHATAWQVGGRHCWRRTCVATGIQHPAGFKFQLGACMTSPLWLLYATGPL